MKPTILDLQKKRTPIEWDRYMKSFYNWISCMDEERLLERKSYRLKKGMYKFLQEEVIPFVEWFKSNYNETFQLMPVDGNQNYDAILYKNGEEIMKLEMCFPVDGKEANYASKELNRVGLYSYGGDFFQLKSGVYKQAESRILDSMQHKGKITYNNTILIFYVGAHRDKSKEYKVFLKNLIQQAKKIRFNANRVELFLPKAVTLNEQTIVIA